MIYPEPRRRPPLQRGIIIVPSAFTLGSLFFGVYSLVAASRGDLEWAGWFIVFAAVLDLLDGRVARFTRTGSAFGAQLDSLVDAISFGVAPAYIIYVLYLADGAWSWLLSFGYITAVVIRLARFNVEQGGHAKQHFHGLPSPTAGMALATYYPFTQTALFQQYLSPLPWPQIMAVLVVLVSLLTLSHVPYRVMPRLSFRTPQSAFMSLVVIVGTTLAVTVPRYYFFPAVLLYTGIGLGRAVILGLLDRLPDRDPLLDEPPESEDERAQTRSVDYGDLAPRHLSAQPTDDASEETS